VRRVLSHTKKKREKKNKIKRTRGGGFHDDIEGGEGVLGLPRQRTTGPVSFDTVQLAARAALNCSV
jgi:hypothetical protein